MKDKIYALFITLMTVSAAVMFLFSVTPVSAEDQERLQEQTQEQIYGSQLMTLQERAEYRERMRTATTEEERERIRKEHHEQMKERAKEQGLTLPDEVPEHGMGGGMGPGGGMGGGMGPGGGMGGGRNN